MQRASLTDVMFTAAGSLPSSPAQMKESGGPVGGKARRCRGGRPPARGSGPWIVETGEEGHK